MLQFQIQPDSEIPSSKQLFDQIRFAIASRQYPPGHRLPSTRQLAMITGLHRNTISKVYQQLEEDGLVESLAGSGIYVKPQGHEGGNTISSPLLQQYPQASQLIQKSIDDLLSQGLTLTQARELFIAEIDWRLRCSAKVWITVPNADLGAGKLMLQELEQSLELPVELVPLEDLSRVLAKAKSGTVVTSRYFIGLAEAKAAPYGIRVIPIDIYDYSQELTMIKKLPQDSRLGIISLSDGILRVAEILIHSLRGDDILVVTAQVSETEKIKSMVRSCQTLLTDQASYPIIQRAIAFLRNDIIRVPDVLCSKSYIGEKSINLLRLELGLGAESPSDNNIPL